MERVKGIEPSYAAWEAAVLPLNYTRAPSPTISFRRVFGQAKAIGGNSHRAMQAGRLPLPAKAAACIIAREWQIRRRNALTG